MTQSEIIQAVADAVQASAQRMSVLVTDCFGDPREEEIEFVIPHLLVDKLQDLVTKLEETP